MMKFVLLVSEDWSKIHWITKKYHSPDKFYALNSFVLIGQTLYIVKTANIQHKIGKSCHYV